MSADVTDTADSAAPTVVASTEGVRTSRLGVSADRARSALVRALPALLGYVATRVLGVSLLAWWAARRGESVWNKLFEFDSGWYATVAKRGYDTAIPPWDPVFHSHSNLAFFPLYPMLTRLAHTVTGLDIQVVAIGVAWVSALAAAWGVFVVADHLYGRRVAFFAAVLWGVIPNSIIMQMAYSESTFTALAAWSLYAAVRRRWVWAGSLAVLAGLTRPTGVAVAVGVCLAAVVEIVRSLHARRSSADGPVLSWRPWFALLIAPLGWLGYIVWVGVRLGRWDGYFRVQQIWGSAFNWRMPVFGWMAGLVGHADAVPLMFVTVSVVVLSSVALFLLSLWQRQPIALVAFSGALILMAIADRGNFWCEARFVLPAFPLVFPVARAFADIRQRSTVVVAILAASAAAAVLGANYLLVAPHYP